MVNSGSSANLAMIEALLRPSKGPAILSKGDGVLVPAIAWPTTIWPLIQLGLEPFFVDVDPQTLVMDFEKARHIVENSNKKIRAVFPIHPLGLGIQDSILDEFSQSLNLVLINDVCESLGSWQGDRHSGTRGKLSSFSFYFSHHMTTMEGGGVATDDEEIYNDLKSIRSHGWSRDRTDIDDWSMEIHPSLRKFTFISSGYNIRPMEIQAAVGRTQLRDLDKMIGQRRKTVAYITEALEDSPLRVLGAPNSGEILSFKRHSWMHIPISVRTQNPQVDLYRIVRYLEDLGIETRPPLTGNFTKQPAMSRFKDLSIKNQNYPAADYVSETTFLVGCHQGLSELQVEYLGANLTKVSKLVKK